MDTAQNRKKKSYLGLIGVCIYIGGFCLPVKWKFDILSLIALTLIALFEAVSSLRNKTNSNMPLALPVAAFLTSMGLSILVSEDVGRSLRLSVSFLPGVLLFYLVSVHFDGTKDISRLYFAVSAALLTIASGLLLAFFRNSGAGPFAWVSDTGSPILLVKNDVTFLALMSPFSLSLLCNKPSRVEGAIAALSLILCIIVTGLFQSRVAALTLVASITCFFILIRPKIGIVCSIITIAILFLIDGGIGFPLSGRFIQQWDGSGRFPLWVSAWEMFLDAPMLGRGPHTFVLLYKAYLNTFSFPSWFFIETRLVPWAHNLYLEVLAGQGILGLITLGYLLFSGFYALQKLRRASPGETRILAYGAFACLAGFCLAAAIELTFLRQWVVVTMFILLGVISQLLIHAPPGKSDLKYPAINRFFQGLTLKTFGITYKKRKEEVL